ncbi:hypothetical protein HPG69_017356 [Diceros bicornis minor]|uniref:Cadherin domain-containing protein n=1 Tax=Diceros bicornis minor TaxID=77932 RepID=A0A7J7EPE6_DICBM|nr:hypothetical protein HPG69_017356 [Diceros bicornis minor]
MCWTRAFQARSRRTKAREEGGTKGLFTRQLKSRGLARACCAGGEGRPPPPDPSAPAPPGACLPLLPSSERFAPYAIDRDSDLDQIFDIDADTGAIVTGKGLDRETAGWHNITVLAMEAGEPGERGRCGKGRGLRGGAKRKKLGKDGPRGGEAKADEQEQGSGKDLKPKAQGQS